jgi:hypothetical protein
MFSVIFIDLCEEKQAVIINIVLPLLFKGKTILFKDSIRSQHHATETNKGSVHVRSFLIQALGLRQCHFYSPAAMPSGKESPVTAKYLIYKTG